MKDREFLMWIHERLENVYGEDPLVGYMHKLRAVISATPPRVDTSTKGFNSLEQLKKTIDAPKELCRECANPIEWDDLTRDGFGNPFHKGCMEDQQ